MSQKTKTTSILFVNIYRFLLILSLYSSARFIFFFLNSTYFPDADVITLFLGGIKFDLPAAIYTNAIFVLMSLFPSQVRYNKVYQNVIKYSVFIVNAITLAMNLADTIFFKFTSKRTTASIFQEFAHEENGATLFFRFLFVDYWYMTVLWVVQMFLFIVAYNNVVLTKPRVKQPVLKYTLIHSVIFLVSAGLLGGAARGGFDGTTRPISLNNAGEFVKKPLEMSVVLNTPFAMLRTINKKIAHKRTYFSQEELSKIYSAYHHPNQEKPQKKMNVVTIVIESFGREYVSAMNQDPLDPNYVGYTPFTDSLIQHSKAYVNAFANGRKSISALPSVIASIPNFYSPFVLSHYSTNSINSIASVLKEEGYYSAFFHGAPNGSMGFEAFMNVAGYDDYYGMTEYNNDDDFDGTWGIWDEPFLQYYAETMNTFKEPFLSSLFTLSSHHPFKIPEKYEDTFKGGPLPLNRGTQYTDYALKRFFETASKMPWFKNTIFVITADHTNQVYYPEYTTSLGLFKVPIIYYVPGDENFVGMDSTITQQIDIFPTIMDYLGVKQDYISFGSSAIDSTGKHFAVNFLDPGTFQVTEGDYTLGFDGEKVTFMYNFKTDRMQEHDLKGTGLAEEKQLEDLAKGIMQEFSERAIDNRMTARGSEE
ncbi:sulfatase-like hydrolase/transferase [Flammeovirga yaeyamensis]|uniref:Sulfatase-like hydrolase/transferase n=1 Tax=Flammeovirga yaeyamensis TaxID=367791 RepID=A0AAX1N5P6_9BACT|nr:alkaline phosphatase family protein [Flammeovirga yaeyamensis]MBB3697462.1 phosphoglycerol transferase MdoB-like AlkP superfamily enzyme [Flammeovirga yaeyamensis]NMF36156.1 sulfatase-like hydrolase/transferase [Flammeovirga yaeyamensis]QWG02889.1 sulfatase-like hydrolase/transferase [Flammeovirga yaeyamensis]